MAQKKIIITSGFFNPVHIGHINLMRESRKLGDLLVVIVNNDNQVRLKGSMEFMQEQERMGIIKSIHGVDQAVLSIDQDISVAKSLERVALQHPGAELIFAKGGDRNASNIPEEEKNVCEKFGIKIVNGVGGSKVQSSSWLLKKVRHGS